LPDIHSAYKVNNIIHLLIAIICSMVCFKHIVNMIRQFCFKNILCLFCILFFTFCFGMAYQGQLIADAAKTGHLCKLLGGQIVRVTSMGGDDQ